MPTNIYALLTPLALIFILIEMGLCWYYKKTYISFQEAVANFGTALGNQTMNVLVAAMVYQVYGFLWEHFRLIDAIKMNLVNSIILLLGIDFIFYWVHRWGHHINILWAAHSPHHSAEEMNFFVALRASVTQRLFSFMFFWPLTIIGFEPIAIYAMTGIHLFISFLHHTEFIPKLWRWIEFIFTTPSHHRVHHGINFTYLDKNYGEFLIVWDRMFGTYAEETDKVIYGMYNPPASWNPITINFHYYSLLWQDARVAHGFDKIKIWFMPLGWRPKGIPPKKELTEVTKTNQVRFETAMFPGAKPYLLCQIIVGLFLMMYIIDPKSPWTNLERWIGSLMLWHTIVNWSGIMESKPWLYASEVVRILIMGSVLIIFSREPLLSLSTLLWSTVSLLSLLWATLFFKLLVSVVPEE